MPIRDQEKLKKYRTEYQQRPEVRAKRYERREKELQSVKAYKEAHPAWYKEYQRLWRLSPKGKYHSQRTTAKRRGIAWQFDFDSWWAVWEASGKWEQRGSRKGQYCMCRPGDIGPYSPDNVFIGLHSVNVSVAQKKH